MEQPLRARRGEQQRDVLRPGAFAVDRDVARIAAEARDVVADPFERGDLVHQRVIAARPALLGGERRVRHEPEQAEPVLHADMDHALAGHVRVGRSARRARAVRAAVDPHHDRPPAGERGRADVERQAVFGGMEPVGAIPPFAVLQASRGRLARVADTRPRDDRGGRAPAQRAERRRGVGNAAEHGVAVDRAARDDPAGDLDPGPVLRRRGRRERERRRGQRRPQLQGRTTCASVPRRTSLIAKSAAPVVTSMNGVETCVMSMPLSRRHLSESP